VRIKSAESWILDFPSNKDAAERTDEKFELIGVTAVDDDGNEGQGWTYTSDYGGGVAVKALLDAVLIPAVIGRDPIDVDVIQRELRHLTHRLGDGIASMAIAAIDIALWDLKGIEQGASLSRMLGRLRDRVPAYGSGKASPSLPIDALVANAVEYAEAGIQAVKIRVGRHPSQDVTRLGAVRSAVGSDVKLMIDANERLDLTNALWLGERLSQFDIHWFEEPLPSGNVDAYRRLREALPVAIAVGEHVSSVREFVPYVTAGAADVLNGDVCIMGGVSEMLRLVHLAEAHGLGVAPHFMTELHVQIAATLPATPYLEYYPFMDELLMTRLEVVDGEIVVPDAPGHGVRFTPDAWARYRVA
jgi:L-alanine-DL-glutamate epimerase-like enolase superfamily enzyme